MAKTPKRKAKAPLAANKKTGKKRAPKRQTAVPGGQKTPETGWDIGFDPEAQLGAAQAPPPSAGKLPLPRELRSHASPGTGSGADVLDRFWTLIESRKGGPVTS